MSKSGLTKIWNKYKDSDDDNVMSVPEGLIEYGQDLDVDLTSESALALAQLCGATLQAENWPKESWISGWTSVGGDTIDKQKDYIHSTPHKLSQDRQFYSKVYSHTFELGKAQGARILSLEDAKAYWGILLAPHLPDDDESEGSNSLSSDDGDPCHFTKRHLEIWLEFLEEQGVAVTKDTWLEVSEVCIQMTRLLKRFSQFLNFIRSIDADFADFDETAAWPSLIDDFVEHYKANK